VDHTTECKFRSADHLVSRDWYDRQRYQNAVDLSGVVEVRVPRSSDGDVGIGISIRFSIYLVDSVEMLRAWNQNINEPYSSLYRMIAIPA
jgi:hypothetical protein